MDLKRSRHAARGLVGLLALLVLVPLAGGEALAGSPWGPVARGVVPVAPEPQGSVIGFSNGVSFDPLQGVPAVPAGLALAAPATGEKGYYLVQGMAPLAPGFADFLRAEGAEPLRYHPQSAFVVRADEATAEHLRGLDAVRWVGPYHPAYRLSSALPAEPGVMARVVIDLFPGEDVRATAARLAALGATDIEVSQTEWNLRLRADLESSLLARAAALPGVDWIEPFYVMMPDNVQAQWVIQTNTSADRRVWDQGVRGQGQVIGIHDSGITTTHCMMEDPLVPIAAPGDYPTHRKVIAYKLVASGLYGDESGHGSHTTTTAVGNDDVNGDTSLYDGMAKDAKLYFTDGGRDAGGIYVPLDLNTLFIQSYNGNAGGQARVTSNSWGSGAGGAYTTSSQDVDEFMWNHPDYLCVFSNGNDGPAVGSVHAPATAKDCISAGGTMNGALADQIYRFTSRGPTDDGRQKPTICAPASLSSARFNTACTFWNMQGTSMASPCMAGGTLLIRDYLAQGFYPTGAAAPGDALTPSAALVKAMAVNSGEDDVSTFHIPDNNIGWGRMHLDDVLYFAGDARKLLLYDETTGLSTGQYDEYLVEVQDAGQALEISLVWTDYPGTPGAAVELVNDLNLTATTGSTTYKGNVYSGGESTTGGVADNRNVEECVQRNTPDLGLWTIRVTALSTPQGPQPYALVVTGGVIAAGTAVPHGEGSAAPAGAALMLTHGPSPARGTSEIRYYLPQSGEVRLTVFDVAGRVVRNLVSGSQAAGAQVAVWNTRDDQGRAVPSGVYFYRLEAAGRNQTEKVVVTR